MYPLKMEKIMQINATPQNTTFQKRIPYTTANELQTIKDGLKGISYKVGNDEVLTGRDLIKHVKSIKQQIAEARKEDLDLFETGLKKANREFKASRAKK